MDMKLFLRTQLVSIMFGLGWILLLNILTYLHHPAKGTMMYIDWLSLLLALVITVIGIVMVKNFIGRRWLALILIPIPFLLVYQPLFPILQKAMGIGSNGYFIAFDFLLVKMGYIMTLSVLTGTLLGILFAKKTQD
jgi:uncharacterized membrane protein